MSHQEPGSVSTLTYDDHVFRISKAEIEATIGDPYWCDTYNHGKGKSIAWFLSFKTEANEGDDEWPPSVQIDGIDLSVKNWHDLTGYETKWDAPTNPDTDEIYGTIYVLEHQLILNGHLAISHRRGNWFQVRASGRDELCGLEFVIDAVAEFTEVRVRGSERDSDETVRDRLRAQIDDSNLEGSPFTLGHRYSSEVKMGEAIYRPKLDA